MYPPKELRELVFLVSHQSLLIVLPENNFCWYVGKDFFVLNLMRKQDVLENRHQELLSRQRQLQEQYQRLQEMQKRKEESSTTSKITGIVDEQLKREEYVPSENDNAPADGTDLEDNVDTSTIT